MRRQFDRRHQRNIQLPVSQRVGQPTGVIVGKLGARQQPRQAKDQRLGIQIIDRPNAQRLVPIWLGRLVVVFAHTAVLLLVGFSKDGRDWRQNQIIIEGLWRAD